VTVREQLTWCALQFLLNDLAYSPKLDLTCLIALPDTIDPLLTRVIFSPKVLTRRPLSVGVKFNEEP